MKLIVGLGNPEKKYENTFHNLGFMCIDKVVKKLNLSFNKEKCKALICDTLINGEKVIFAKPLTYMNLSGESVLELVNYFKIDLSDLVVLYDDFDLEKGKIRIRKSGSAGTHNGMRNIISLLNNENFARIRVGFKPEKMVMPLIDLVLSGIHGEDVELFEKATDTVSNAVIDFCNNEEFDKIVQKYSGKN